MCIRDSFHAGQNRVCLDEKVTFDTCGGMESRAQYTARHYHSPYNRLLVRSRTLLGRSPTPKPVHTHLRFTLLGSPKRVDSVVYRFARAFMPLIAFYPVSVSLVSAADSDLCLALPTANVDGYTEIPDCARCPVRRLGPVAEQRHRL